MKMFNESMSHPRDTLYQHQKIVTILQTPSDGGQDDKSGIGKKILLEKLSYPGHFFNNRIFLVKYF